MPLQQKNFRPRQESVVNRGMACSLAATQPERAFAIAASIPDGWYRCQAMTAVGRNKSGPLADKAFAAARTAAAAGDDAYQQAAVLCGTLHAALDCKRAELAKVVLQDILRLIPVVEPMASRAFALSWLWRVACTAGDARMRHMVVDTVVGYCHPDRSWRAARLYRELAAGLAWYRPDLAEALIRAMPPGKARTSLERRRAAGERHRAWTE